MPDQSSLESSQTNVAIENAGGLRRRCPRWVLMGLPIVIGLGLSFAISFGKWLQEEQSRLFFIGLDGMCLYLAIGSAVMFAVVIAIIYFRPSRRTIVPTCAVIVLLCFGASKLIRIDGYNGNRTPRIIWRWAPQAETQIKTYLTSKTRIDMIPVSLDVFTPSEHDFPELLGKDRLARVNHVDLESNWVLEQPRLLWRHPVGLGWSSFAVVGNAAVTLEQREENECVVCYELRTGVELWCHSELTRFNHEYGDGPRSTPTIRDGRVFSMGATGALTCVDFKSGEPIWKQSVFTNAKSQNLIFGMAGSPLVFQDTVVVTPGAGEGASAIAYSVDTGSEIWRSGNDQASYASPVSAPICGQMQILSFNGEGLRSYAADGKSLWLQPWVTQGDSRVNVAQPIVLGVNEVDQPTGTDENGNPWAKILISSGYDKGTALLKVTRVDESWTPEVIWESNQLKSKLSNFVVYQNHAYGLDNGLLTCIDLKTGERVWKRGRYGHGKLLLVKDKLLIQAESGEILLVAATPKAHSELAKCDALSSKTWNNLALAGNVLVVRNDREAAAFELPIK